MKNDNEAERLQQQAQQRIEAKAIEAGRVIIGETERAGLPISAPVFKDTPALPGALRWRKSGETFVLEQYGRKGCCRHIGWHEVPCIVER